MADQAQTKMASRPLTQLPLRLHHQAFAVKDQEVNRRFIEDVLGIPLCATWCERVFRPEVGREVDYCHTFYELADGGALAFFQFADDEAWEKNRAIMQEVGGSLHSAFKVTQAFTVDAPNAAEISAMRRKDAHSELARWLGGDRRTNNGDRPH
jgi:catechol 2,3-dioxygenase-like lactoylglutathione lyase family enzyme